MHKQVERSHYEFWRYMDKRRWASVWHQVDEVIRFQPSRVLEIGPGAGVLKAIMCAYEFPTETLDLDPDLRPDHVASVFEMPFQSGAFDVVCAFQMLEHLPYEASIRAFREMSRVAKHGIVISLPDARAVWLCRVHIPKMGAREFFVRRPFSPETTHVFDGQHYWEINKKGYRLERVMLDFAVPGWTLERTYRVADNPYHRFFVFRKVLPIDATGVP